MDSNNVNIISLVAMDETFRALGKDLDTLKVAVADSKEIKLGLELAHEVIRARRDDVQLKLVELGATDGLWS